MGSTRKLLAASLVVAMLPAAAYAQAAPQAPDGDTTQASGEQLGDIVVTATKKARAEELQRVPAAITAFGPQQIANTFAINITDIGQAAPNVRLQQVGSIPGVANFTIRGMGFNSSIASDEPTVGVIVDGVYLASNYGALVDTFDLESIEILRGPQGTLFGRNVTAGAVNIRTRRPSGETKLDARLNVGSAGRAEVSLAVEGAITDTLSARLSGTYRSLDGYFSNRALGGRKIDSRSDVDARPTLVWKPDDVTSVTLIGQYSRYRDGGAAARLLVTPGYGLQRSGYMPPTRDGVLDQDFPSFSNIDIYGTTLEATRVVGAGVLTSVTGFRKIDYSTNLDLDGTAVSFFRSYGAVKQRQISEELRYAGTALDDRLDYTIGVYGFSQKLDSDSLTLVVPAPTSSLVAQGTIRETSLSAFAQVQYGFGGGVSIIAGGRVNHDRKRAILGYGVRRAGAAIGDCNPAFFPALVCGRSFDDAKTWNDFSPKLGLNWQLDGQTLLYASATRGFRSGGYNVRNFNVLASPGPYEPETVTTYEGGIKKDYLAGRLRTNFTGFYSAYTNLQRTVLAPNATSTILNAANARIWGLEFEGAVIPVKGLRIDGAIGYTNARYKSFSGLDLTGDGIPDPALAVGLRLERAPEVTWSVGGTWDIYSGPLGAFTANVAYSFTDKMPVDTANSFFLPAYRLLDASIRWTTPDKHMTVAVFGKNLTDQFYGVTGVNVSAIGRGVYYSPPRSYGVEANFHF